MPWQAFGVGTDEGTERTTASKKIWQDPAGFIAAQDKFKAEVAKLKTIADAADMKALAQQVSAVGAACKSCHETYRE
jgi:cytochrome c556